MWLQPLPLASTPRLNGKRVDAHGEALPFDTSPVLWGEPGTNGQHAYFQMLHQGTEVVPVEFVAVKKPLHTLPEHHELLLANVLAQAQALMVGKSDAGGHKHFTGNRPSTFLLLDKLSPASLGALIALQEHRVFVSGSVWGINSFDQWGVELGKVLAKDAQMRLASGNTSGLDGSTAGLLHKLRSA
jgi:glucose-6-phosphate isomerase